MNHFSTDDIKQFADQLRLQRQAVLEAIRQRLHQADAPDELALFNYYTDVREQSEADLLTDTDIGQLQIELADLRNIDDALARIGAGTYGICVHCGSPITERRLRAHPAARMCLGCQEILEQHR